MANKKHCREFLLKNSIGEKNTGEKTDIANGEIHPIRKKQTVKVMG